MYTLGEGVPKDSAKAVEWYRAAAVQGLADGQYYLGMMYAEGDGVQRDNVLAYGWFKLAAITGKTAAITKRAHAQSQLSDNELAEAQRLSSGWKKGQVLVR